MGLIQSFFPLLLSGLVHAAPPIVAPTTLPTGGQVVAGNATISSSTTANTAVMNVNQTSQRAVVNWDSFNVGKNAAVNFNQPNANAVTLNRVTGASASMIEGAIKANGQVILVNPNGVTFGRGSEVHAAAVVASTLNIADKEFMDGKSNFKDDGTGVGSKAGKITNKGTITTNNESGEGGFIALLAPEVRNQGYLLAQKGGTVAIGSGSHITLHIQGQSLVAIKVEESVYNGLISNKRIIEAPGGLVVMATGAANQLMAGIIKNTGKISANALVNNGGTIELVANTITQAGQITTNSQTQEGGQVNLIGKEITLAKNSQTTATGATGGGQVNIGLANTQASGGTQVNSKAPEAIKANADQAASTKQLARSVTIEENATMDTSATQSGNGGTIAIWSELKTTIAGILKSMGGALSGNGGFIETSSKGQVALASTAHINTSANNQAGKAGTWLLDPVDLTIDQTVANLISQILSSSNVTIAVTNATTACPIGSCTQTSSGSGSNSSSLTIASGADILKVGNTYTTLTLSSEGIFNLNANISGQNLDVIIQSSIAYLGVGTSINASKVTVQAQTIYAQGNISTSNYLLGANPGSLGNAIELLAQAIYVSGRLSANTTQGSGIAGSIKLEANTITLQAGALLEANGDAGGLVTIAANDASFTSTTIQANGGNGRGGTLSITAANDQYFINTALLANGTTDGGAITITTSRGDISLTNSLIQTNGSSGRGGSIGLSATNSTQIASSNISANGYTQGGQILIGNDATNGSLPFSMVTSIDEHSTINAAQLDTSLSNQAGGFIETSGQTLNLLASINAGSGGMWLLDPTNVTIDSVMASNIVSQLTAGSSVTIQTTNTTPICGLVVCVAASPGVGDITVASDIVVTSIAGTGSLTLTAYNNINVNANITLYGNLTLNAQVVNVASGTTIHLNETSGTGVNLLPATFNSSNWVGNGSYGTYNSYSSIVAGPVGSVVYYSKAISGLVIGQSYTLSFSTYIPSYSSCGGVVANCAALYMGALWITGSNAYTSTSTPLSGVGIAGSGAVAGGTGYTIISNMSPFTPTAGVTSVSTSVGNPTQLSVNTDGVVVTANVIALASTMTLEYIVRNDPSFSRIWNASLTSNSVPSVLTINNSSVSTASNIVGVISGSAGTSFVKQGAGALILGSANTYDGGTRVDEGALRIGNNFALGAGPLLMATNTSLHAAASAVSIANNVSLTGNATINIPSGNTFSLSGVVDDGGHGLIVAGQGNLTLSNPSNTISALSSSGPVGVLVVKNSGPLTLGSDTGMLAATSMDIETTIGNITIAGNLSATSSSNNAIVIAAGTALLQGSSDGGSDILISGSPTITTGFGGRAMLYTGSLSGSAGFTNALVPFGNYRYNSSKLIRGYTAALGSGVYLIYRQQPLLTITADDVNMPYGSPLLPRFPVGISGLLNGDLASSVSDGYVFTSATVFNPAANTITASAGEIFSITPFGYSSTLGYGIANAPGTLTMVTAPLIVKAIGVRQQEGSPFIGGNGVALIGLTNFDTASSLIGEVTYSGSSQGASAAGTYVIEPGGLSSPNYTITYISGALVLTPKPIYQTIFVPPPIMVFTAPPPPPPAKVPPIAMAMAAPTSVGGEIASPPLGAPPPGAPPPGAPPPGAVAAAEGGALVGPGGAAPRPPGAPPSASPEAPAPRGAAAPAPGPESSSKSVGPEGVANGKSSGADGKSSTSKSERVSKYEARRLAGGKGDSNKVDSKQAALGVNASSAKYAGKYANGVRGADKVGATKDGTPKAAGTASSKPATAREGKYSNLANATVNVPVNSPAMVPGMNNLPQLTASGLPPVVGMPVELVPPPIVLRGGDSLTQSYDDVPSIRNSGVANVGRSKTTENYHESLESVNLMSTLNLFIIR